MSKRERERERSRTSVIDSLIWRGDSSFHHALASMEGEEEASGAMIDEIYSNGGEEKRRPIISGEQLDIEAYASLYGGRTKVTRLLFIADHCGNSSMQLEALRMAYDEVKKGENTQLFREIVQKIDGRLGPNYGLDQAWSESVDRKAEQRKEKLENELNAYKVLNSYLLLLFWLCSLKIIEIDFIRFAFISLLLFRYLFSVSGASFLYEKKKMIFQSIRLCSDNMFINVGWKWILLARTFSVLIE